MKSLSAFLITCFVTAFLVTSPIHASTFVIRDSIGTGPSLTNGMPGGVTDHDGSAWNTPGLVVTTPEDGRLIEARFVIFGRGPGPEFPPENNLANFYGYAMEFHIWTDGVEGGADSFDLNPRGSHVTGHIDIDVNSQFNTGHITVVPFGQTGPVNEFTTFLLTVDLSSFNLVLEGGTQYVMGLIDDNLSNFISGGGFYRISASRATGPEDVFRAFNTNPTLRPGYLKSQLGNTFEQYAGSFTLSPLIPGDYDYDGDVDTFDYNKWRLTYGSTTDLMADGNDDGVVDAADYVFWRNHFPTMASASSGANVPEPTASLLLVIGCLMYLGSSGRWRLEFDGYDSLDGGKTRCRGVNLSAQPNLAEYSLYRA